MKRFAMMSFLVLLIFGPTGAQQSPVIPVLFLNGTGAHAELPNALTDNLVNATVEGWVKWESLNKWARIFDFGKEGNAAVLQNERETTTLLFSIWDRSGKLHRAQGFKVIEENTWQHLAIVSGKTGMRLYVNGKQVGENDYVLPFNAISGGKNYIGKSNWPGDEPFHGYIADFRVWSTSRSQSEIQQTMFTQLKGDEPGLAGYWRFESAQANQSNDLGPNALHAKLLEGATVMSAPGPPISLVSLKPDTPQGIPPADLHKLMLEVALNDHRIDSSEQALIQTVRQAGSLSATQAQEIENAIRKDLKVGPQTPQEETYFQTLETAHKDGRLTQNEITLLEQMQSTLNLSSTRANQLVQTLPQIAQEEKPSAPPPTGSTDAYRVLVRTALMDRHIDANEQSMLKQIAESDKLTEDAAAEVLMMTKKELGIGPQTEPEKTYFTVLKTALADGELSATEEAMLQSMQASLKLSDERVTALTTDAKASSPKPSSETGP